MRGRCYHTYIEGAGEKERNGINLPLYWETSKREHAKLKIDIHMAKK